MDPPRSADPFFGNAVKALGHFAMQAGHPEEAERSLREHLARLEALREHRTK